MLDYNQITPRKYIVLDNEPYEVLSSQISKKSRQKASNQTKLKNLITSSVVEKAFHQSDAVEEADIDTKKITYLYEKRLPASQRGQAGGEYFFCAEGNPKDRFSLSDAIIGDQYNFLKKNASVDALVFDEEIIGITLPIKMDLAVKEAPPGVKGNTAQGGSKQVVLETGALVSTPLFINKGDVIRINTETGEYVERVEKA